MTQQSLFADLLFRSAFPRWAALLLFALCAAGTVWFYHREAIKLSAARRWSLIALRILTFGLLLFLILKPVLDSETGETRKSPVWVLFDNTGSMLTKDIRVNPADQTRLALAMDKLKPDAKLEGAGTFGELSEQKPTRLDVVKYVLANPRIDLLKQLEAKGPTSAYAFGLRARGLDRSDEKAWPKALTGSDNRTSLMEVVYDLLKVDDSDLPAAIFIASDGRDNASNINWDELGRVCADRKVPLHIFGVGVNGNGYLQLREALIPETQFVEDTVSVPLRWRVEDVRDGEVQIDLKLNDRVVATKRVKVKPGQDQAATIEYVPEKKDAVGGKQEMTVTVAIVGRAETLKDSVAKSVRVVDRKIKLLFVEQSPRWEFKFIQRAMLRDRRVDSTYLLVEGDPRAMEAGAPFLKEFPATRKELFAYDMLILGDVKSDFLSREQQEWVRDFVAEGGGLVMIAGRKYAPATYERSPIADTLPVEFKAVAFPEDDFKQPEDFRPRVSEAGERNGLLMLADTIEENAKVWAGLPPWFWFYPITKLKPGAVGLLEHDRAKLDDKPMPLMAAQYFGKGLVLFCGFEETWRWRFNEADKYFGRFWGQVVYQVGLPHSMGSKLAQIQLEQGETELGKPTRVFARLFNGEYKPLALERVKAKIEKLDAKPGEAKTQELTFEAVPGQPGEYVATLANDKLGKYQMRISEGLPEPAVLDFRVSLPPEHELAPGGMNEDALRNLATRSGGAFYREEDLHKLGTNIKEKSFEQYRRKEVLLWNRWLLLAVVGMFTAEWLLRKYSNMS